MIPALATSKFDMIVTSMTITDDRKKVVDFPVSTTMFPCALPQPRSFPSLQPGLSGWQDDHHAENSSRANYLKATYPDSRILAVDKEPVICLKLAAGWDDIASGSSVVSAEAFLKPP